MFDIVLRVNGTDDLTSQRFFYLRPHARNISAAQMAVISACGYLCVRIGSGLHSLSVCPLNSWPKCLDKLPFRDEGRLCCRAADTVPRQCRLLCNPAALYISPQQRPQDG